MKKKTSLQEIARIMKDCHLTTDEVVDFIKKNSDTTPQYLPKGSIAPLDLKNFSIYQFDLLCSVDWNVKRVSWQDGACNYPRGLFPFKDDNHYLMLHDVNYIAPRAHVFEHCLPTIDFCKRLFPLLPKINEALETLRLPELSGCYYARANEQDYKNWIVTFDSSAAGLQYCCHEDSMMATVCYFQEYHQ